MKKTILIRIIFLSCTSFLSMSQVIFEEVCDQKIYHEAEQMRMFDKFWKIMESRLFLFEGQMKKDFEAFPKNVQNTLQLQTSQLVQTFDEQRKNLFGEIYNISKRIEDLELYQSSVNIVWQNQHTSIKSEMNNISTRIQDMESSLSSAFDNVHRDFQHNISEMRDKFTKLDAVVEKIETRLNKSDFTYFEIVRNISKNGESLNQVLRDISLIESSVNNTVHNTESKMTFKFEKGINASNEALSNMQTSLNSLHKENEEHRAKLANFEIRLDESSIIAEFLKNNLSLIEDNLLVAVEEGQRNCMWKINSTKTDISQVLQRLFTIDKSLSAKIMNNENSMNKLNSTLSSVTVGQRNCMRTINSTKAYISQVSQNLSEVNITLLMKVVGTNNSLNSLTSTLTSVAEEQRNCTRTINSTKAYISQVSQSLYAVNLTLSMKVVNTENSLNSLHSTLNTAQHDINSLSSGLFNASGSISSIQNSVQVVTNSDAAQNVQIATMQSRYESYNTSITLLSTIVKAAFEVRLVGSSSCGRVEVSYVGVWGTICDDAWDINDANVVCRMLGYSSGGRAFSQATYGRGSGKIWLDQVQCDGTESSLWECPKNPIGIHDCGHHEDASVCCVGLLMQHAPIEKPSEWNRMENT